MKSVIMVSIIYTNIIKSEPEDKKMPQDIMPEVNWHIGN